MIALGLGISLTNRTGGATASISLSASSVDEDASLSTVIGTLSVVNGSGSYTFSITADPDSKFDLDGADLINDAAFDYETATSHSVTIEADNGVDDPISDTFVITVTNVYEAATLSALSGTFTLAENAAQNDIAGALSGKTSGSTLSLADDAGGRVALSGTNIVRGATALNYESATSHNFTVRETLADSANSPRDTVLSLTVTDVDEVAPTLSSPSGTETSDTTADLSVSTNEGNGTLYWFVSTSATPPSSTDLKAGTGAVDSDSQSVSGTGAQTAEATGLTAETTYYAHFLHTDAASNDSSISTSAGFTTEAAAGYDYYIDDALGDDGDDGSSGSPWQSLNKINALSLSAGATIDVLVKAGTYDKTTDFIERDGSGGEPGAGATLNITFETGCTMDGAAASAISETNGFEFGGSNAWTVNITGNGLVVQHYNYTTGGVSPNGVGCRGSVTVNVSEVRTTDCVDGFSGHETATLNLTDCEADACIKAPFVHVGSATVTALRCSFTELSGGGSSEMDICDTAFTGTITCTQCEFIPDGSSSRFRAGGGIFDRCKLGTTSAGLNLQWTSGQGVPEITDSYVNVYADGAFSVTALRCFGKWTSRIRPGGTHDVQHCVFSGGGAGQASIILGTTNLSGCQTLTFSNNVLETASATACSNITSTVAGYMASASALTQYNCLSGSATYDNDWISADSGGTGRTGTISSDALIGAANTTAMADYAFDTGSPCIGAGSGGSDIGFGAGSVVSVGIP